MMKNKIIDAAIIIFVYVFWIPIAMCIYYFCKAYGATECWCKEKYYTYRKIPYYKMSGKFGDYIVKDDL